MQVASSPYASSVPHSHYLSYYQLHPPGPQDHDLKRQYLALLPPQQIIEICLTFDLNVSPYVRSTVWPPDLNAAIASLQKPPQTPAEKPAEEAPKDGENVMDSLKSPAAPTESTPAVQGTEPATEPQPPDKEGSSPIPEPSSVAPPDATSTTTSAAAPAQNASSTTSTAAEPPPPNSVAPGAQPTTPVQPHYPHQPYGYTQASYPISSYYAQVGAYSYPYGAYANTMQSSYHSQPSTAYPAQPPIYNPMIPHTSQHQQHQQEGAGADDLPSYEEMIVEALTGCTDPEGWAPKDLFAWMASRYPLQSNFRPSASQALQKAYKRGRFEKSSSGKYRRNPAWEGGNTTRRTTRRPQTQNSQSTPGNSAPTPPFTHAPLVHHHHGSSSAHPAVQQPYASQPYGYHGYPHYPGYPSQPQPLSSVAPPPTTGASSSTPADKPATVNASTDANSDAYEAAQNILSAINFGNLYELPPEERQDGADQSREAEQHATAAVGRDGSTATNGVENLLSHVQAMLASNAAGSSTDAAMSAPHRPQTAGDGTVEDPRAELQAQLALLSAQLAELAQVEEVVHPVQPTPALVPTRAPTLAHTPYSAPPAPTPPQVLSALPPPPPPPPPVYPTASAVSLPPPPDYDSDVDAEGDADIPETMPEEEESNDDDMEEVI